MSYVIAHNLTRHYDLSDPWLVRLLSRREKHLLTAVDKVSFTIEKGATYALVGESGSGKSTIAKMMAGLIKPSSGKVTIGGEDFADAGLDSDKLYALRQSIQMVFQSPYASLNPRWKVGDIIMEPIKAFRLLDAKQAQYHYAVELLEQVGLSAGDMQKYPHEFSGGQRQRISIARALAAKPQMIICDEPTSALDVSVQAQVLNLLKDLQKQFALTYLFISHDLAVISTMATMIGVLKDGKLVEEATPKNLFRTPKHAYTKMLLEAAPDIGMGVSPPNPRPPSAAGRIY